MKRRLIEKLRCVKCGHNKLQLEVISEDNTDIVRGSLICPLCFSNYEIKEGIPLLHPPSLSLRMKEARSSESLWCKLDKAHFRETDKLAE